MAAAAAAGEGGAGAGAGALAEPVVALGPSPAAQHGRCSKRQCGRVSPLVWRLRGGREHVIVQHALQCYAPGICKSCGRYLCRALYHSSWH